MIPCNKKTHSDTMDVSFDISLHEYGIVRNPTNDDTVFCLNPTSDFPENKHKYKYSNYNISLDDVKEALRDAEDGYFSYIGSDRKTEIDRLDNGYLSYTIFFLNQYNGHFDPHTY